MLISYISFFIGILLGILLIVVAICAIWAEPQKEYAKQNRLYWSVLNACSGILLKIMRIHLCVSGEKKIPDNKTIYLIGRAESKLDYLIIGYAFRKRTFAFSSQITNLEFVQKCGEPLVVVSICGDAYFNKHIWQSADVCVKILEVIPGENVKNADPDTLCIALEHILRYPKNTE